MEASMQYYCATSFASASDYTNLKKGFQPSDYCVPALYMAGATDWQRPKTFRYSRKAKRP